MTWLLLKLPMDFTLTLSLLINQKPRYSELYGQPSYPERVIVRVEGQAVDPVTT